MYIYYTCYWMCHIIFPLQCVLTNAFKLYMYYNALLYAYANVCLRVVYAFYLFIFFLFLANTFEMLSDSLNGNDHAFEFVFNLIDAMSKT